MSRPGVSVAALAPGHWDQALSLVAGAGLPTADLVPGHQTFLGAFLGSDLVGVIAWEALGTEALVRSFAVKPEFRGSGVGTELYTALETGARKAGTGRLVLLTETAEAFFSRRGFRRAERTALSEAVRATAEFTELCPQSAAVLTKDL